MHRLGGLLNRLRREAASANSEPAQPPPVPEQGNKEGILDTSTGSSENGSLSEDQEGGSKGNLKQLRHKARRERQRQRKQLGHQELANSDSISVEKDGQILNEEHKEPTKLSLGFTEPLSAKLWFRVTESNLSQENFLKGAKWSPTGDRIATNSEDGKLRIYHCPGARVVDSTSLELRDPDEKVVCSSDCIYDMAWYPYANAEVEGSSLMAISARARPGIQLWDVTNGTLRASYTAYDHLEGVSAPNSLCFSSDATKLIGGFENLIRVFSLDCPGRNSTDYPTSGQRRGRNVFSDEENALPGIISALAINPDFSRVFAAGTFRGRIMLYHEDTCEPIFALQHHGGSIAQLKFSPCGNYLYSASRKENSIHCFDIRNTASVLWTVTRSSHNHQRVGFDIDPRGQILASASQDGCVKLWDLTQGSPAEISSDLPHCPDAVNTFQFHPYLPYWCMATGQRHYNLNKKQEDSSSEDSSSDEETSSSSKSKPTPTNHLIVGYFDELLRQSADSEMVGDASM